MLSTSTEALAVLAKHTGLGTLAFGSDRICSIEVGESLVVEVEDMPDTRDMRLNASVRVVGDADFSVLRQLLVANFNGKGTGNAALSINPANGEIVLTQAVDPRHHTASGFIETVERFIRYALFWEDRCAGLRPSVETRSTETEPADIITLRL